jgi:hypothetical protein
MLKVVFMAVVTIVFELLDPVFRYLEASVWRIRATLVFLYVVGFVVAHCLEEWWNGQPTWKRDQKSPPSSEEEG